MGTGAAQTKTGPSNKAYLLPLAFPFGWLAWTTFVYMGARTRHRRWAAWGVAYLALIVAALVLVGSNGAGDDGRNSETVDAVGTVLSLLVWGVATIHALAARQEFLHRLRLRSMSARHEMEVRVAGEIAARDPGMARRIGIGRPDRTRAEHAGLVDVNSVPVTVLSRLAGFDDALAAQAAETRPFASAEEMGSVLDLPAQVVEDLRERTIFIGR